MLRVILVATCSVLLVSPGFRANSQNQVPELTPAQTPYLPKVISTSIAIRRIAQILDAQSIRIEAGQLFSPTAMKKLRPQLSAFPEMRLSCTEWFWVAFHWEGSQPTETGRTFIGCY